MNYVNNPFFGNRFNRLIYWFWQRFLCFWGVHLFDEILPAGFDPWKSYFRCDACGYTVFIREWMPGMHCYIKYPEEKYPGEWDEYYNLGKEMYKQEMK